MNLKPLPLWSVIGTFAVCGPLVVCDRSYAAPPESTTASEADKDVVDAILESHRRGAVWTKVRAADVAEAAR